GPPRSGRTVPHDRQKTRCDRVRGRASPAVDAGARSDEFDKSQRVGGKYPPLQSRTEVLDELLDGRIEQGASRCRQMRVKGGGFGGVVSQHSLDQPQIDAGFQKMRGVRVAQSVNGDMLVQSKPWACFFKDPLNAFPANMANFGFGTGRRKQPGHRAVSFPKTPEHSEDGRRQRHVTIPVALAANVEQQTLSIDIADLQLHALADAQPTRIDGGKKNAVKGSPKAAEQLADFFPTHDRRNFVFPAWSHYPEHRPGTLQRVLIEEFYGAESNGGIGARDLALVGEEEKVLANLFLGQL